MGEHKLKGVRAELVSALADAIGGGMADRGKLLEDGFTAFVKHFYSAGVDDAQRRDLRQCWFLACDHLFFGVMGAMSDGPTITERDEARMAGVDDELKQFRREALGESQPGPSRPQ